MILLFFPPPGTPQNVGDLDLLHDGQSAIYDLYPQFVIDVDFIDSTSEIYALEQVSFTVHLGLLDPVSDIYPFDDVEFVLHLPLIDESSGVFEFAQVYFTVKIPWIIDRTGQIFELLVNAVQTQFAFDWQTSDAPYESLRYADFTFDWQEAPVIGLDLTVDARIYENVTSDLTIDYKVGLSTYKDFTFDWQSAASSIARATFTFNWQTNGVLPLNIFYNGVDITRDVYIDECNFVSQVNGQAGACMIRVKDPDQNKVFVVGKNLDLKIEGQYMWRGFVSAVNYEFPFDYGNTSPSGIANQTRIIKIEGTDVNVLFEKRWTFNQDDETQGALTYKYDNVPDTVAIKELVTNWLDLSGDGIDITTKVENVGTINTEEDASPFSPGWTWGQAMDSIAFLPVAIYYINPEKQLVYTDAETENTDMVLSDQPSTVAEPDIGIGYREASYLLDGSKMVNDYLAWGAAGGSDSKVFKRETDQTSVDLHGRWQGAKNYYAGVYKQSTINKIASSVVNGSPQSNRGGADDIVQVTCSTYTPGFFPGMKVRFISHAHGINQVLPIRSMEITFAGAVTRPKYTLRLGYDRDPVYGYFDNIIYTPPGTWPDVVIPGLPRPPRAVTFPGVVLDSFTRITEWSYIPYWTREDGLPGQGPSPALGWVSEGWQTGEEVTWTHPMTALYENPQAYVPIWVDGGAGILLSAMPYVPQYHDGPDPWASTTIPNISSGGTPIDRKNLIMQFSIDRHERILPSQITEVRNEINSVYADNGWWKNYDNSPEYIAATGTSIVSYGAEYASNFWTASGAGFAYDNPLWKAQQAGWGAGVKTGSALWSFKVSKYGPSGSVVRLIHFSSGPPTDYGGTQTPTWWGACGGGFGNIYDRYGNGCQTYPNYFNGEYIARWINANQGLGYFGGHRTSDLVMIGEDTDQFLFDQKLYILFSSGGHNITINREEGGPSGYSLSGSDSVSALVSTRPATGTFLQTTSNVSLQPGVEYNLRWFRPNPYNSYVKIWPYGSGEPDEWTATARQQTDSKSLSGSAVDAANDTIEAFAAWGVTAGEPIRYLAQNGEEPIGGLTSGATYFAITTGDPNKIRLAATYGDALDGIYIEIDGQWATGSHTFGWNTYDPNGTVAQQFFMSARHYTYQTYKAKLHFLGSISDSVAGRDEPLPDSATRPPKNSYYYQEKPSVEGNDRKTRWPYVPGTLMIWINGTFQRPGVDFVEVSPSAGTFRFIGFTPSSNDKIQLWYLVA